MPVARIMAPVGDEPLYFDFVKWDGPPPPLVRQHLESFTVAGIDGSGARLIGAYGDAFTVRAIGVFAAWGSTANRELFTAERAAYRCRELIGQPCKLSYEGLDYGALYDTRYQVEDVQIEGIKRHVRILGPGYDYVLGAVHIVNWTLRPIYFGEGEPVPLPGTEGPNNPPLE